MMYGLTRDEEALVDKRDIANVDMKTQQVLLVLVG
jgi:hypothetical protein